MTIHVATLELKKLMETESEKIHEIDLLFCQNLCVLYEHSALVAKLLLELNERLKKIEEDAKEFYLQKAVNHES